MHLLNEAQMTSVVGRGTEEELVRLGTIGISWTGVMASAGVGCAIGSLGGPIGKLAGCGIGMGAGLFASILNAIGAVANLRTA